MTITPVINGINPIETYSIVCDWVRWFCDGARVSSFLKAAAKMELEQNTMRNILKKFDHQGIWSFWTSDGRTKEIWTVVEPQLIVTLWFPSYEMICWWRLKRKLGRNGQFPAIVMIHNLWKVTALKSFLSILTGNFVMTAEFTLAETKKMTIDRRYSERLSQDDLQRWMCKLIIRWFEVKVNSWLKINVVRENSWRPLDFLLSENLQPMYRKTQKIGIFVEWKTKVGFRIDDFMSETFSRFWLADNSTTLRTEE